MKLVRTHAERGYEILRGAGLSAAVSQMALHHHEALDGSRYPPGLTAEALSMQNRMFMARDVVESLSSSRLCRASLSAKTIVLRLVTGKGTKYGNDVVDSIVEVPSDAEFILEEQLPFSYRTRRSKMDTLPISRRASVW